MVIDAVFLYIHVITAVSVTILLKSKAAKRYFQIIIEFEESLLKNGRSEVIDVYLKHCRLNNGLGIFLTITVVVTGGVWFVVSKRNSYALVRTGTCPFIRGAVFQLWYPFDTEKYPWGYSIHDTFFVVVCSMLIVYQKTAPLTLILFIIGQIKVVQHKVTVICKEVDPEAVTANIKECLKDHQDVIRLVSFISLLLIFGCTTGHTS
nr:unnamed protein product [Callosobruchus chinensis]